jgi:aryl-alcohol dehydrogenase-like predicted oxidoreductase
MEHHLLGRTGVSVSQLCLGAMMFGAWGNPDHDESIRIIHAALDAGITFIDTADVYAQGESEEIVGKALAGGRRDDVILATKFHGAMGDDPNQHGSSRRWIIRAVENSLRRLGTDWIDLYQVHRPRTDTDIEDTLGALTDLVHQGKVRYIGSCTFPASQIVEAQWVARDRHLQRFVTEQPAYSILARAIEGDILPTCRRHGMGVLSYGPLTGGWLSGRWRKDTGQQSRAPSGCPSASTSPSPPTSASSTPSNSSPSSPTRPASRSSSSRSRLPSTTPPSPRRSSGRARCSNSKASSPRPRWS